MEPLFQKAFNSLIDWGPGIIIALVMLYGLYKLVHGVGLKIVAALEKPAEALTQQAKSMDRMTTSLEQYVSRDQIEHKEIILLLKVIAGKVNHIEEKADGT